MAVDYTKRYTYTDTKNTYTDLRNAAKEEDANARQQQRLQYAGYGASLGSSIGTVAGGGVGAAIGGIIGAVGGWLSGVIAGNMDPINTAKEKVYSQIRYNNQEYYNSALKTQSSRNDVITQAQYYVNKTRGNFEQTYGKESFSMLESTISALLNMSSTKEGNLRMSELLGGLERDTIVGDIKTRLYTTDLQDVKYDDEGKEISRTSLGGQIDEGKLQELSSQYLNLESLGKYYITSLYESIVNSDTSIGDSARQLSESEKYASEQLELNLESTMANNANKFAELFLNMRSQNISNAQKMGSSEAESGASGIKASRSSRTNNQLTKLNQDIANASYAILYDQYKKQLDIDIANGKLSREQLGFQYFSQREQLYRQMKASYQSSLDSWWESTTKYAKTIGDAEVQTDDYMAGAKAGEDFLKRNEQEYDDSIRYIYSTGTATL